MDNALRFAQFFNKHNVLAVALASVFSTRIDDISNSIVDNLILPFLNTDIDNDGQVDIKSLEHKTIQIGVVVLPIGKVYLSLMKIAIITVIICTILNFVNV